MWIELTTGADRFPKQGAAARRNCNILTFVRIEDRIVPLFLAFQNKEKGFKDTQLISVIPSTDKFQDAGIDTGTWYVNRHEVKPGTEILIEYRYRASTGFGESIEHLMVIADPDAPLYRGRIDLPDHPMSSVPNAFFEGRFLAVSDDEQLPQRGREVWHKHFSLSDKHMVADVLDPNQPEEEQVFHLTELEAGVNRVSKAEVKTDAKGNRRTKIKRGRRIRTRRGG